MSPFRKILRFLAVAIVLMAASLVSFHFWLLAHAKGIITEFVNSQSAGRYNLEVKKVKYNYLKLKLELDEPVLKSVDSSNRNDRFELRTRSISLQLERLWPLISGRKLMISAILMDHPLLTIQHQKRTRQKQLTSFSLSEEMEQAYQSIQSVLKTLKVGNFRINNGAFAMRFPTLKNSPPLTIKDIDFFIKGLNIDTNTVSHNPNSFTEDIQLKIAGQTINFPDGSKSIRFSSFRFVANKGNLEVDSCSISGGENDSTRANFNLFAEKMRIKNVYLASNDSGSYNRIDSLFFTKPKVTFSVELKDVKKDSSETISTALRNITSAAFGRLLVRYVSINNVVFDVEVERKEKRSTFNFVQDRLEISNLGIGVFPSMPISASNIRFGVKEFVDYFRDSTYLVHFDSVRINNDQFSLFNFNIESTNKVKKGSQKIYIPVLQIQGIDWYEVISQKRLVATNLTLNDPSISIIAAGTVKNKDAKKNASPGRVLRETFLLKDIKILNGTVKYIFHGDDYLQVKKINTTVSPDRFTLDNIPALQGSVQQFNTGELIYQKDGWKVVASNVLYGKNSSLTAGNVDISNSRKDLHLNANKVDINGISGAPKTNKLDIKRISWLNAKIEMNAAQRSNANNTSTLSLGTISGGTTDFKFTNSKALVHASMSALKSGPILIENGKPTELKDLAIEGTAFDIIAESTRIHSGKFSFADQKESRFTNLSAKLPLSNQIIDITSPAVVFVMKLQDFIDKSVDISQVKIIQPTIDISSAAEPIARENGNQLFPTMNIQNILVTDPLLTFRNKLDQQPVKVQMGESLISLAAISTSKDRKRLALSDLNLQSKGFQLVHNDSLKIASNQGFVKLHLKEIFMHSQPDTVLGNWELSGGSAELANLQLLTKKRISGSDTLVLSSFHADNFAASERSLRSLSSYLNYNPGIMANHLNFTFTNSKDRFMVSGLRANLHRLELDSFSFHPQITKADFMAAQEFQKDYISFETGALSINHYNVDAWLNDSIINIGRVHISNGLLHATRDKQLPFREDVIKGLPVTLIKHIPLKTQIDTLTISSGDIRYHEVGEKTHQTGTMRFNRVEATINNIKNYDINSHDSLNVSASGFLMDSASVRLSMKESYYDSLATFSIFVSARPFDLKLLNPFLLPVMSVKIKSGFTDALQMKAIAREYLSLGEMRFFYHDLRVEFLKGGTDQKKTLLTGLITFAANSLVIRKNNTHRVGRVFYERNRNRSVFNYMVKMIASGGASSVGAKRNRKYNRLYKNKLKELKLPEMEF